ncbi:MAG: DUF4369 domain-containing protein [Muribaculaceae bacterium]
MKYISSVILIAIVACGCTNISNNYQVTGDITGHKHADSVFLYTYEKDYKSLCLLNKCKVNRNSTFRLDGVNNNSKIAFLKIKGDTIPYYFVLNNDNVNLSIKKNGYILQGNAENRDYFAYRCKRQEIIKTKKALWAKYKKLVSDSLLSDSIELQLKGKNDELIDSLHRMTNRYIDSNTTASELVLRKFGR